MFLHMPLPCGCFNPRASITEEAPSELGFEGNGEPNTEGGSCSPGDQVRINPVIRTYIYPQDITSRRRYILLLLAVIGGFTWWLGPLVGVFIADPMVQLLLLEGQVVTPSSDCFDPSQSNQTCSSDIMVDYYLWNITNQDEWTAGLAPPQYQEVGPFAFRAKEVRYNMQYDWNWTQVEYTFHQWAEFLPDKSCPACTMDANITSVNRGYLQFLSAPAQGTVNQESAVIFDMMPVTLSVINQSMTAAVDVAQPGSPSLQQDVIKQWTDCSYLEPLIPILNLSSPYLKDFPLPPGTPGFPFNPEFCAFIPAAVKAQTGLTVMPSQFAAYGLAINYTAASTFLSLAIGKSNFTHLDAAAVQFLDAFLTMPQATVLGAVGAVNPAAAAALSTLTPTQWLLLQGYIASLVPTWGTMVMTDWVTAGGGGMILTKTVDTWLYGFEDPLLLTAAQAAAPGTYRLTPWTYTPFIALTFPNETTPMDYFQHVTGIPYNTSMLTWNSSDIGHYHPLIQQKRLDTGKAAGSVPQTIYQYRGVPFSNRTWGILNVTGIAEGVAFGNALDSSKTQIAWDSVLNRPVSMAYTGFQSDAQGVPMLVYNLTNDAVAPCNWTHYAAWATSTGFNVTSYHSAMASITPTSYWSLVRNDTALSQYFNSSPLASDLGRYFSNLDVLRDRCAVPESFQGMWDMSSMLACPTIYTFPRFLGAGDFVVNSTGATTSAWSADPGQHGYSISIEPFTGFSLSGHKTYQVNHLVSKTPNLYPNLWVAPGSAAVAGMKNDFVTVPTFWVRMWWEPTPSAAALIHLLATLNQGLYYCLVVCFPVVGWLLFGPALFFLRFGKQAKLRRSALVGIQRSRAHSARMNTKELEVINGLERIAHGSVGVVLPTWSSSQGTEEEVSDLEGAEQGQISTRKIISAHRLSGMPHFGIPRLASSASQSERSKTPNERQLAVDGEPLFHEGNCTSSRNPSNGESTIITPAFKRPHLSVEEPLLAANGTDRKTSGTEAHGLHKDFRSTHRSIESEIKPMNVAQSSAVAPPTAIAAAPGMVASIPGWQSFLMQPTATVPTESVQTSIDSAEQGDVDSK